MATAEESKHLSEYWQSQISAWEQTDQSQKSFCEQNDLNYHRFGYWRRKFQQPRPVNSINRGKGFVPVRHSPETAAAGLLLTLPNGIKIQGIESANLPLVSQLLQQL